MDFLNEAISVYTETHTEPESAVLAALNRDTQAHVLMPRMLSGHLQGQVLRMLSSMIKPKRILEIGTYTGYSAICLAEGLPEDGHLHTIDINDELRPMVDRYLQQAGLTKKVTVHTGNALDIIPTLKETFDVVFIDADKINYARYFDLAFPSVPVGGYFLADNVLWSGKVLDDPAAMDADTRAIDAFNKKVSNDKRLFNVLFPIRDGLMVVRKLAE